MTAPTGPLLASGRDADIFAYGDGLVLRRSRQGRSMEAEARVMEYARGHGYPVPAVDHLSDDGTDMVMERLAGRSMMEVLGRRPWTLRSLGALLGDLHRRLHDIPAPDWLVQAPGAPGDRLVHLDLHPMNVIVGPAGPVVIDWTNAGRGLAATDVALTWVLMAAGDVPGRRLTSAVLSRARQALIASFLATVDAGAARAELRRVVEWKVGDPHMSAAEQRRMWTAVASAETPAAR
jgi:aminoglycoside phosphotransferase (APT) family kinase protein